MSSNASDSPSPREPARSSRVCLNCRRKKKRCDKALPSCGRCTYSLEVCQHEDDAGGMIDASHGAIAYGAGLFNFESFASRNPSSPPMLGIDSTFGSLIGSATDKPSVLTPAVFSSLDSGEDVHSYVLRCVSKTVGDRPAVEHIVSHYFKTVNFWFTIVERDDFEKRLSDMYTNPSAETGLVALAMLLILRMNNMDRRMDDSVYLSVKSAFALVQCRVPLSVTLLQAQLLIAMYETSHSLAQQAYLSITNCTTMGRAFGWHRKDSWSGEKQRQNPRDFKLYSILWWAVVFVDCHLNSGYPDESYPPITAGCDLSVPFPESLDQYIQSHDSLPPVSFLDENVDNIGTVVWPEGRSAFYSCAVIQQLTGMPQAAAVDSGDLSDSITAHAINLTANCWKYGNRVAGVCLAFVALLKLNLPYISGRSMAPGQSSSGAHRRPIDTVTSVVNVVHSMSLAINATGDLMGGHPIPTSACICMYKAAMTLVAHGETVLCDPAWLEKVDSLKRTLRVFSRRWRLADDYVRSIDLGLEARLSPFMRT